MHSTDEYITGIVIELVLSKAKNQVHASNWYMSEMIRLKYGASTQ